MMYDLDEEIKVGIGGEWIANNLALGDTIAIPNEITNPLWAMLMDKGPHFIESNFEDG